MQKIVGARPFARPINKKEGFLLISIAKGALVKTMSLGIL